MGTGVRGTRFWGKYLNDNYGDVIEYVGLCDINPGRLEYALDHMGVDCPVFTDFDAMLAEAKPDLVIVTTVDSTHDEFIVKVPNAAGRLRIGKGETINVGWTSEDCRALDFLP